MGKLNDREVVSNSLMGQAIGDAFGVPVEFLSRKQVQKINLHDMVGKESALPFISRWSTLIPKGSWSDDTSMTIASMTSFIQNHGKIDYDDQMKQFIRWWEQKEYCCLEFPFGLGRTISTAMERYQHGVPALECGGIQIRDNGNGALMRILPFSMYCILHELDLDQTAKIISEASGITHGHQISQMSCFVWTEFMRQLVYGKSIENAIAGTEEVPYDQWFSADTLNALSFIKEKRIKEISENDIGETGYVVDTLYSAFYSLLHGHDFESTIRAAINLGYDADTAGAVTGMAAGIYYGVKGIPDRWMQDLRSKELLLKTASAFTEAMSDWL